MEPSPKESLDYQFYLRNMLFLVFLLFIFLFVEFLSMLSLTNLNDNNETFVRYFLTAGGIVLAIWLPFLIYYLVRMGNVAKMKDIIIQETVLSKVIDDSWLDRAVALEGEVEVDGEKMKKSTEKIFIRRQPFFNDFAFSEYVGKEVTVG
jgi:hypothetical protein